MSEWSESNRQLTLRTADDGKGNIEVAVEDSGPGIPPERLPRLFDSFFTTKMHGMGLGHSIVRSIVEAHGGQIRAENNLSGGRLLPIHAACDWEGVSQAVAADFFGTSSAACHNATNRLRSSA